MIIIMEKKPIFTLLKRVCDTDVKMKLGSTSQVDFFYKRIIKADGDYEDWSTVQVFPLLTDRPLTTCILLHYFVYRGPAGFCLHAKPPWVIFLQELLCRILLHCFGRLFTFSLVYHGFSWYRFYSLFYLAILFQVLMMIVIISFVVLMLIFFFIICWTCFVSCSAPVIKWAEHCI